MKVTMVMFVISSMLLTVFTCLATLVLSYISSNTARSLPVSPYLNFNSVENGGQIQTRCILGVKRVIGILYEIEHCNQTQWHSDYIFTDLIWYSKNTSLQSASRSNNAVSTFQITCKVLSFVLENFLK